MSSQANSLKQLIGTSRVHFEKRHGVQKPKYIKPTKSAVKTLKMQNGGKSKKHKKHKKSRTTKSRKKSKANRKPRYFHFMSL